MARENRRISSLPWVTSWFRMMAMARDSSLQGKMGCVPLLIWTVVIFVLIAFWMNRGIFGFDTSEGSWLVWLGLEPAKVVASEKPSGPVFTVTLAETLSSRSDGAEESGTVHRDSGLSQKYGTGTLNQPVRAVFKKTSGGKASIVMPTGTVVEIVEGEGARAKIRYMGRVGWLSTEALE